MLEIRNKFTFPHGNGIWVLINDRFEENLISTCLAEIFSQDPTIKSFFHYDDDDDDVVIQFNYMEYYDTIWCKVVPLTTYKVVLGKPWIEER